MFGPDPRSLDALDRFWDEAARRDQSNATAASIHLEPVVAATVFRLHEQDDAPVPDSDFLARLRRELMERSLAPAGAGPNGRAPVGLSAPVALAQPATVSIAAPNRAPTKRRIAAGWGGRSVSLIEFAAVCLLLAAIVGIASGNLPLAGLLGRVQEDRDGETAMFLGNAARTGEMPGPGPDGEVGLQWRVPGGARDWAPDSSPVVADGVVYFVTRYHDVEAGTVDTGMAALDLAGGRYLWEVPLDGFISAGSSVGPVVADGLVYIGISAEYWLGGPPATPEAGATPTATAHMAGALVALDARTGEQVWSYETARAGEWSPAVSDGTAFVLAEDGTLHAVDATTGDPIWSASVSDDATRGLASSPAVADGTVYVASNAGRLYAFDAASGRERWSAAIGGLHPTTPVVAGGTVFVGADSDSPLHPNDPLFPKESLQLYALDTVTGHERWSLVLESRLESAPTVAGDSVVLTGRGAGRNEVVAVSAIDGTERWRFATGGSTFFPAVWSGETVYVGSTDANLYALDRTTGEVRWRFGTGDRVSGAVFVDDGFVVFGTFDGKIDGSMHAVGAVETGPGTPGSSETPSEPPSQSGTPPAATAPPGDVSDLPPCDVEPRPVLEQGEDGLYVLPVEGTPRAGLVPNDGPSVLWSELPGGEPAPKDGTDAIRATIAEMIVCDRPGLERYLAAYFSDDFLRRSNDLAYTGNYYFGAPGLDVGDFERAFVLPDGRVATFFRSPTPAGDDADGDGAVDFGSLVVWVEQDGRWLVDEWATVSETPVALG